MRVLPALKIFWRSFRLVRRIILWSFIFGLILVITGNTFFERTAPAQSNLDFPEIMAALQTTGAWILDRIWPILLNGLIIVLPLWLGWHMLMRALFLRDTSSQRNNDD